MLKIARCSYSGELRNLMDLEIRSIPRMGLAIIKRTGHIPLAETACKISLQELIRYVCIAKGTTGTDNTKIITLFCQKM